MRVALLTREYPPEVYGGAGVHVEHLAAALADHVEVQVHAFGAARGEPLVAGTYEPWSALDGDRPHDAALRHLSVDLAMAAGVAGVDIAHSHTWYANLAGHLVGLIHDIPHVMTSHSLEPLRPWKAEQLGGGYRVSSWAERVGAEHAAAIIAVSEEMRRDVLASYPRVDEQRVHVIHNGIDTQVYRPVADTEVLERHGIDATRPSVVFVGRITRQKGLPHLLDAAAHLDEEAQLVLCAGAPDTPEIEQEVRTQVEALQRQRSGVIWIAEMLPRSDIVQILSHATVFACPSIYEPFGLVNTEAMGCEAAVVASAVGGIPEVVVDGETGYLVSYERGDDAFGSPRHPEVFARDFAERLNALVREPGRARRFGEAGRRRAVEVFSWDAIAERTVELYRSLG